MEIKLYLEESTEHEQTLLMYQLLDEDRKYQAETENYERAAALRDVMKIVSAFVLGQEELEPEFVQVMYYAAIEYGDLVDDYTNDDGEECEVYSVDDQFFHFSIDKKKEVLMNDQDAMYNFLYRKHAKNKSMKQLFKLWWIQSGRNMYNNEQGT